MKKIIDGKLYNTETAKRLGSGDNGYAANDFSYYREELYRKKTGEYFLFGEGGPASNYAQHCPDGWRGGWNITPLTEKEARKWSEDHLDADEYIGIWGEPEE